MSRPNAIAFSLAQHLLDNPEGVAPLGDGALSVVAADCNVLSDPDLFKEIQRLLKRYQVPGDKYPATLKSVDTLCKNFLKKFQPDGNELPDDADIGGDEDGEKAELPELTEDEQKAALLVVATALKDEGVHPTWTSRFQAFAAADERFHPKNKHGLTMEMVRDAAKRFKQNQPGHEQPIIAPATEDKMSESRFLTFDEVKQAAHRYLEAHPEFRNAGEALRAQAFDWEAKKEAILAVFAKYDLALTESGYDLKTNSLFFDLVIGEISLTRLNTIQSDIAATQWIDRTTVSADKGRIVLSLYL